MVFVFLANTDELFSDIGADLSGTVYKKANAEHVPKIMAARPSQRCLWILSRMHDFRLNLNTHDLSVVAECQLPGNIGYRLLTKLIPEPSEIETMMRSILGDRVEADTHLHQILPRFSLLCGLTKQKGGVKQGSSWNLITVISLIRHPFTP